MTTLTLCQRSQQLREHMFFSNFLEYFRENENFHKTVFSCILYMDPRWNFWIKKGWKSSDTVLLKGVCYEIFDLKFFSLFKPIWAPDKQAKVF